MRGMTHTQEVQECKFWYVIHLEHIRVYIYVYMCVCVCVYIYRYIYKTVSSIPWFCLVSSYVLFTIQHGYDRFHPTVQIKSKSLLLSHHHSTCALVTEIIEIVLQTVQKQLTYRQYHYILTDLYRWQCAIYTYIYSVHTVYYRHTYSYQYTLYTVCTHSTLCTHIHTHNNMQMCSRLYISWIHKCHVCALDGIQW